MNDYIETLKESSDFQNKDFINGLIAGLDASQHIARDNELPLAETQQFDELYDFVVKHFGDLL